MSPTPPSGKAAQPMSARVFSWDWRQQPPMSSIAAAVTELSASVPMVCTACRNPVSPGRWHGEPTGHWVHDLSDDYLDCPVPAGTPVMAMVAAGNENVPRKAARPPEREVWEATAAAVTGATAKASGAWHDGWTFASRDGDGNLILRYEPSGGLYRVLPVEETWHG